MKRLVITAVAAALALGTAPLPASAAPDEIVIVDVAPVSRDLASHLRVGRDKLPGAVELPSKLAAVVCKVSLKQLRESRGAGPRANCVAVGMSQGLIDAVRRDMRGR